ncbi:MAG: hypothetical protein JJT96_03055 [Opitutales bacterium]|nr:hypothetical protein [Opitutales bacterium]
MLKPSSNSILIQFSKVLTLALGCFVFCGNLLADGVAGEGELAKTAEINTGFEEPLPNYQSVTLSIGWPSLLESKINSLSLPGGNAIPETDDAFWSRESLQMGVIPEPRFLAVVVALVAGSVLLALRRRRNWAL